MIEEKKKEDKIVKKQWWIVLRRDSYADFPVGIYPTSTAKAAVAKAKKETEFGAFSCTADRLFAVPVGFDIALAKEAFSQQRIVAQEQQAAALSR